MTALGAYVRIPIPFSPVPITLQTFFVILGGAVLGKRLGTVCQASYVGLGILGMPIFQGYAGGLLHLAGPTGGYLIGFIAASFLLGGIMDRKRTNGDIGLAYVLFAMSAAQAAIFLFGIAHLAISYKLGIGKAIMIGFVPFFPGAVVKLILASWIYSRLRIRTDQLIYR